MIDDCLEVFRNIEGEKKGTEILSQDPFQVRISAFVSSAWGWGGMPMRIQLVEEGESTRLVLTGYIAQRATGPLKYKLDEFESELSMLCQQGDESYPAGLLPRSKKEGEEWKWSAKDK